MYTNGTTNYNLPQYIDNDKATWTDLNAPFNQIDAAIKAAVDDTAQEALDIDALKSRMNIAEQNIGTNITDIAGLDIRLTTAEGAITSQAAQITDVKQDTEDMICAYNEASATSTHAYTVGDYFIYNDVLYRVTQVIAIGDTIVPDTNCETTNVTTEILAIDDLSGDVSQLENDVESLQIKVSKSVNSKEILNTQLTNTTFQSIFSTVASTINANRDYDDYTVKLNEEVYHLGAISDDIIKLHSTYLEPDGSLTIRSMSFNTSNAGVFLSYNCATNNTIGNIDLLSNTTPRDMRVVISGFRYTNT